MTEELKAADTGMFASPRPVRVAAATGHGESRTQAGRLSVGGDELRKDQALFLELRLVRYLASCSATLLAETFLLLSKMTRT